MRYKLLFAAFLILAISLYVGRVVIANSLSTSGLALAEVNIEISKLRIENDILNEKLLGLSSLTSIATRAASLGFTYTNDKISLISPPPIALRE